MNQLLKEITQISIYLKEKTERINEVSLFQPLRNTSPFNEESKPLKARRWRYTGYLPFFRRLSLKIQSCLFKYLPSLIPSDRLTPEAKFKTVLAILLAQEEIRDFFLRDSNRQEEFFHAITEAGSATGYFFSPPSLPTKENPIKISRQLTHINGRDLSLIDDLTELNLQIAALNYQERSEILFGILSRVKRPPITSVVEISNADIIHAFSITTHYAQYKISLYDKTAQKISYHFAADHATSSIKTRTNSLPNAKGTINQRFACEAETDKWISSYCGELSTPFHVLEQILLILGQTSGECEICPNSDERAIEKKILFTSLYSWDEIARITDQKAAIRSWDQKVIKCSAQYFKLNLLYFNIPFNALNKYPSPGEIKASMQDINDETTIMLFAEAWALLGLQSEELMAMAKKVCAIKSLNDNLFLEKENALIVEVDAFRRMKSVLLTSLPLIPEHLNFVLGALLTDKKPNGKPLKGIDKLLYLNYLADFLGYFHNKNCENATDRSAGADAADKAQHVYRKIYNNPFLPGSVSEEEAAFFKVLYSMYLVWEEPEINTWLSTGFMGEKFYNNFFQKNPETTRYLVKWLQRHPEIYLGLSDYRT